MIPKISLTAAFLLLVAPPMASASNRETANRAPLTCQAHEAPLGIVVAQDAQQNLGTGTDSDSDNNDNDNDSNDNDSDNQNDNNNQMEQQNANGNEQPAAVPPQVFNAPDNDSNDAPQNQAPQPEPVNPYQ